MNRAGTDRESGVVAVWTMLMIVILCGALAMSVDVGLVGYESLHAQRSADAAALGGVIFLPDDLGLAADTANGLAVKNGFSTGVSAIRGDKDNRLRVTITRTVPSFFAKLFGKQSFTVQREAVAEYLRPLGLGSPDAQLGNDPESAAAQANFWLSQFGPASRKHDGDRFGADVCVDDPSDANTPVYQCTSNSNTRGNNPEFQNTGYRYAIEAANPPAGKDLLVEVFDPVIANVGNRCTEGRFPTATELSVLSAWIGDAAVRYTDGSTTSGLDWCTGDSVGYVWPSGYSGPVATSTRFDIFSPSRDDVTGAEVTNTLPPTTTTTSTTTIAPPPTTAAPTTTGPAATTTTSAPGTTTTSTAPGTTTTTTTTVATTSTTTTTSTTMPVTTTTSASPPTTILLGSGPIPGPCSPATSETKTLRIRNYRPQSLVAYPIDRFCNRGTGIVVAGTGGIVNIGWANRRQRWQIFDPWTGSMIEDFNLNNMSGTQTKSYYAPPTTTTSTTTTSTTTTTPTTTTPSTTTTAPGATTTTSAGSTTTTAPASTTTSAAPTTTTATLPPGPTVAGPCSEPQITGESLTITNLRSTPLELDWIDTGCVVRHLMTIPPGATVPIASYDGSRYRVSDTATGWLVDDFVVSSTLTDRVYRAPTGGAAPSVTGPSVCTRTFRTFDFSGYSGSDPTSGTMYQLLNPADGVRDNGAGLRDAAAEEFALGFRRWVTVCRIAAADVIAGTYTLGVRTDLEDPVGGTGVNRFAVRAVWADPITQARSATGIATYALERLPVFVNLGGSASSDLYMTRILPIHAGHRLRVELYDIGDTQSGTVTLEFLPPTGGTGSAWSCTITKLTSSGSSAAGSGCTIANLARSDFNGNAVRIAASIPEDYSCAIADPLQCWTKIRMTFNGGAQPTDQTTWSAIIEGDPIRLVR